jgi:putative ABC transport system substrate-binding protein
MTEIRGQKSEVSKTSALRSAFLRAPTSLLLALTALLFALCFPAEAQQRKKLPRIGYISNDAGPELREKAFLQGLHDLQYFDGKNIHLDFRYAHRNEEKLKALAEDLAKLRVDIIVTTGSLVTRAAQQATNTIPIVMIGTGDPVGTGFVASLARPGGNITGSSALSPELSGKRLELLRETLPSTSRVGIFWNPDNPATVLSMEEAKAAAPGLRLNIQSLPFRNRDDLQKLFSTTSRKNMDALMVMRGGTGPPVYRAIIDFAAKSWLPAMYPLTELVENGGLMAYGVSQVELYRRAAIYIDKILKGAKPAELPVEQPTKFELVINLKTAKQIDVTIPQRVLQRADRVIR